MENSENILHILNNFNRLKEQEIPNELNEYLRYVAKTGDTIFNWNQIKNLISEKLSSSLKDFHNSASNIDEIPVCPNVDVFNFDRMKTSLLERLELFSAAPFTVQRICELLADPKKQYSRIDKFMRALEKNILVVSTTDPGHKQSENDIRESLEINGNISLDDDNEGTTQHLPEQPKVSDCEFHISPKLSNTHKLENDDCLPNPKKLKLEDTEEKVELMDSKDDSKNEPDDKVENLTEMEQCNADVKEKNLEEENILPDKKEDSEVDDIIVVEKNVPVVSDGLQEVDHTKDDDLQKEKDNSEETSEELEDKLLIDKDPQDIKEETETETPKEQSD